MARKFATSIITGSTLLTGQVVYWAAGECWVPYLDKAMTYEDAETLSQTLETVKQSHAHHVADCMAQPVSIDSDGHTCPVDLRETIRDQGPTVRTDLGYQSGEERHVSL